MSYEDIRIPQELSESVLRAVGLYPRRHEALGELVKGVAAQRGVRRPAMRSGLTARSSTPTASWTP
jgi:hypothetical protein